MIFVVLGMHKSGTTLIARTLHQSGIYMGQDFPVNASYSNSKFEAKWAQSINDRILSADRKTLSLEVTSDLLPANIDEHDIKPRMVSEISSMSEKYEDWGFKDPRSSLTYGFWKKVLPDHRIIVIYRDPVEVWKRYSRVNRRWYTRRAFDVWADYNRCILKDTADVDEQDILFIKFEDILGDTAEFNRLEKFTGKTLEDVRDPSQSRFRVMGDKEKSIRYRFLRKLAGNGVFRIYEELERKSVSQ